MYIILNWSDEENIFPVIWEDGTTMLFDSFLSAKEYAEKELSFNWKIINLSDNIQS